MSWKFRVYYDPSYLEGYIIQKYNPSTGQYAYREGEDEVIEAGVGRVIKNPKPWLRISEGDIPELIQALAYSKGVRLESADKAELDATKRHLSDMQKIVFKTLGVEGERDG